MRFLLILLLFITTICFADNQTQLISFDFQKINVRDLLRILAKYSDKNIIINDQVANPEISLHLQNVSWQQALATVLTSQALTQKQIGNAIIISPLQLEKQQQQLEPLTSRVIALHYAKAQDLANMLKDKNNNLLSERGNIGIDTRTNSLLIEDTTTQIEQLAQIINQLDYAAPQVAIEARVVTVDSSYEQDLGVRFGVSGGHHLSGTLNGANQLAGRVDPAAIPLKDRLNFDFAAAPTGGNAGSIGLALFKLADGYMLDLELSALQAEGAGEIIAKPSLVTANQQAAVIQTGEDIPYQEKTSSGATNVAFKKAVLSLEVTPQITPDKHILLTLHISQDKPSSKLVNGVPAIETREINTQVLVNNNQTLVLGGIYEEAENHQIERIPFVSDIPIIGNLFKHQHEQKEKRELLIFVRPSILLQNNEA